MRGPSNQSAAHLLRLLCIQNPFYLISALVVLFGLRQCAAAGGELAGGWMLMCVICGYTLLLAAAVGVIIRLGRVWDDARMILLVIVLLFLALSVSFDKVVLNNPLAGAPLLLWGLVFSVALSEGLLRALGMRLALVYRVPYYAMLSLLFGYPLLLAWLSLDGYIHALAWGVYLFPWLAGGAFLTLLPAARRGHADRRANGTPWRWPLYPWTLFVFLWLCFAIRTYWVSFAFEARWGLEAQFEPHFLAPLVLAAAIVLLEIGVATRRRVVQRVAMLLPLAVIPLALFDTAASDSPFAELFRSSLGSPAQLACWALLAFYSASWLRSVRFGEAGLVATLLLCSVVNAGTVNLATFALPQPLPLDFAAVLLVSLGIAQHRKWKAAAGGALVIVSSSLRDGGLVWELATMHRGYYALHLLVLAVFLVALVSKDRFSQAVRRIGYVALPVAAWLAAAGYDALYPALAPHVHTLYVFALAVTAWGLWNRQQHTRDLAGTMATSLAGAIAPAKRVYLLLQTTLLERALPFLVVGLVLLALAVLISLYKGGLLRRGWSALRQLNDQLRRHPSG